MIRRRHLALLTIATMLAACGGGRGAGRGPGGSSVLPSTNSKSPGVASFSFKLPGKSTMSRVRRPYYVSQATLGVAIDWSSTNPRSPDFAAPLSATCPGTLPSGVTSCTTDSSGDTDYQFQLTIPAGAYPNFNVTTFDAAPTGTLPSAGSFSTANMLAQGMIAGGVTIQSGEPNTIQNLTFYGVPASVSFVPAEAQGHVIPDNGGYGIIGNIPQTFYAQSLDADGYAIGSTDSGAPAITITESGTDSPQYFTIAPTSNPFAFTVHAVASPTSASIAGTLNVVATSADTNLSPAQQSFSLTAIPEVWMAANNESTGLVTGYALSGTYAGFSPTSSPVDTITTNFPASAMTVDSSGDVWVYDGNTTIHGYTPGSFNIPYSTGATISGFEAIEALAVDSSNRLWVADAEAPDGNGQVVAYNIANPASPSLLSNETITGTSHTSIENPDALTVASNSSSTPSALRGTVWVSGDGNGTFDVIQPGAGSASATDADQYVNPGIGSIGSMAVTQDLQLWVYDSSESQIEYFSVNSNNLPLTTSSEGSLDIEGEYAYGAAADTSDQGWFPLEYDGGGDIQSFTNGEGLNYANSLSELEGMSPESVAISP